MVSMQKTNILKGIEKILLSACNKNVFSASSVALYDNGLGNNEHFKISCGYTDDYRDVKIDNSTFFDLASLTKPLVTLLSILLLIDKNKLSWSDTIDLVLPGYKPHFYLDVDIYHLLCHSSGLPAHREYWRALDKIDTRKRRQWLISEILSEKEVFKKGSKHLYSDLGYLLLGFIVEEITGLNLACYWNESIAKPMGLECELFFPVPCPARVDNFAVTSASDQSRLQAVVHDNNSRALGGITGHAGLFGTASGVIKLCQEILHSLNGKKNSLPFSTQTLKRACSKVGDSEWTAGFNMPSRHGSSSGKYFSEKSIGHLGFTGTSFWIDPVKQLAVVLLTNRVIKGEKQEGIKELRPYVHNYIVEQLRLENKPPLPD